MSNRRICVTNKGEIEDGAFTLLGASTKEGQDKIGFFGSGNKYAIATLLRNGIPFDVYSGDKAIDISTEPIVFGGQEYNRILINGQPTSFTTRMGPSWEIWFAIREFICNAMDEEDYTYDVVECSQEDPVQKGRTSIYIGPSQEVDDFIDSRSSYLLDSEALLSINTVYGDVEAYPNPDEKFVAFRKCIRVTPLTDERASLYKYNFSKIDINESRLIPYDYLVPERLAKFFLQCTDVDILKRYLENNNSSKFVEHSVSFQYEGCTMAREWEQAIGNYAITSRTIAEGMPAEDLHEVYIVPEYLATLIADQFPNIIVLGSKDREFVIVEDPDPQWVDKADRALSECIEFGLELNEFSVQFVKFFRRQVMANCNRITKKISLSVDHLNDYDELVSTMYEEMSHTLGFGDCTRAFEQFLMGDLIEAKREIIRLNKYIEEKMI